MLVELKANFEINVLQTQFRHGNLLLASNFAFETSDPNSHILGEIFTIKFGVKFSIGFVELGGQTFVDGWKLWDTNLGVTSEATDVRKFMFDNFGRNNEPLKFLGFRFINHLKLESGDGVFERHESVPWKFEHAALQFTNGNIVFGLAVSEFLASWSQFQNRWMNFRGGIHENYGTIIGNWFIFSVSYFTAGIEGVISIDWKLANIQMIPKWCSGFSIFLKYQPL